MATIHAETSTGPVAKTNAPLARRTENVCVARSIYVPRALKASTACETRHTYLEVGEPAKPVSTWRRVWAEARDSPAVGRALIIPVLDNAEA